MDFQRKLRMRDFFFFKVGINKFMTHECPKVVSKKVGSNEWESSS